MKCAFCEETISGKPIRQNGQYFCSLECADLAAGNGFDEDSYFDEEPVDMFDDE
mgnify:CR=1 FL=1